MARPHQGYPGMPGGGGEVDVNALFESQTIDQLWETLSTKRKESEMMQLSLRQLVGDRYKDLLSASDMIVGMGDICDYLTDSYEEACTKRTRDLRRRSSAATAADTAVDVRDEAARMTSGVHQLRSWLGEGRYAEAALTAAGVARIVARLEAHGAGADGYLAKQIKRARSRLETVPGGILKHACAALEVAHKDPPRLQGLTATCAQAVVALALLDDGASVLAVLQRVVSHLEAQLRWASTTAGTAPDLIYNCVTTLYAMRHFVYKAFVERSVGLVDSVELTQVATLPAAAMANKTLMDLASHVSSSEYFDPAALDDLHFDLPLVDDARAVLARWQDTNAPVVLHVLRRVLEAQHSVKAVIDINEQLRALTGVWQQGAIQARPPQAWMDSIEEAVKDRLVLILNTELESFVQDTRTRLAEYTAAVRDGVALVETPAVEESVLSQRYACLPHSAKPTAWRDEFGDPSLPPAANTFLDHFFTATTRVLTSLALISRCVGRQKQQHAAAAFKDALHRLCGVVEKAVAAHPAPATGLAVQGASRALTYATHVQRQERAKDAQGADAAGGVPWLDSTVLDTTHTALHAQYLACFAGWVEETAGAFAADVAEALDGEYWGPDKQVYERIVWSRWEHQEEDDQIVSHLPSGPTATLLAALQRTSAATSSLAASLLRREVVDLLHRRMMAAVFPFYTTLLAHSTPSGERAVCQPALWQLLLDVKLIGVVCSVSTHGCPSYDAALKALLDSDAGIDPVYWSTERGAFENIFARTCDAVHLLLATHGMRKSAVKPADAGARNAREAVYVDFVAECDRFPTLHLAPLTTAATTAAAYDLGAHAMPAAKGGVGASPGGPAAQGTAALSGGLQGLQQLGAGLQQQFKGMKYFQWR